jgi:ATP-binding cassette subfamily F protein uup
MAILLSAHELGKSFAARPLFQGLTFAVESGERIGLIGPNGAGKSTLLRILAGQADPDQGTLSRQRGLRIGYLEQVPSFKSGKSVHETVLEGVADPNDWKSAGFAEEVISRLQLQGEAAVDQLSGGWKKRVALARELARQPDLLLLDEPTNHLDVDSIFWLEDFLRSARFATVTITHDRAFLQKVSNRIVELDRRNPGGMLSVAGDYVKYLETKQMLVDSQQAQETRLKNTLRRETEWLRQGAKARTTKQQARINRAETLKDTVGELEYRNQNRTVKLEFSDAEKNPKKLIQAKGIRKKYGERTIFAGVDLMLTPGARIGLLGPNGCGKSTLIRTLLKELPADSGEITHSDNLQVAYFEQNREALDPNLTVLKTICPSGEFVDYRGGRIHVRSYLDRFLFDAGKMEMAVGKLSGGEQSRLLIALLMMREANLLVLDEPTNDLDLGTLGVLQDCLTEFGGAVLLVTHDRFFLDQVATKIIAFDPDPAFSAAGKLTSFANLEQWETWHRERSEIAATAAKAAANKKADTKGGGSKKKLSYRDQRELDQMEDTLLKAETERDRLVAESEKPENSANAVKLTELSNSLAEAQQKVDDLYARWAELTSG